MSRVGLPICIVLRRGSLLRTVMLVITLVTLLAIVGDRGALAGTARTGASGRSAIPLLQPADGDTPSMREGAVYPPPASIPVGVSICGPLFSNTSLPACQTSGTTISAQKGGLATYGLSIRAAQGHGFPNLKRDITLSQEEASGLDVVLAHGKFDGLLGNTQVVMLDAIARRLGQKLQPGNVYHLEVDQKTANLDYHEVLIGVATFTYVP